MKGWLVAGKIAAIGLGLAAASLAGALAGLAYDRLCQALENQ